MSHRVCRIYAGPPDPPPGPRSILLSPVPVLHWYPGDGDDAAAAGARMGFRSCILSVWTTLVWLGLAAAAHAGAIDLTDSTPRWILVHFEVSPADQPGRLDSSWSVPRRAYLEPADSPDEVRIRVPAKTVEAQLLSTGTDVVPGTFSEFVWTLERRSGHVLAAELTGRVRERLSLGLIATSIVVDIRVEMTTRNVAGFRSARGALGIETHDFCSPSRPLEGCILVEARQLDPARGYINAVGRLDAATRMIEVHTFSPLGEVRFSERTAAGRGEPSGLAVVSNPPPTADAVCSRELDRGCEPDRGGES